MAVQNLLEAETRRWRWYWLVWMKNIGCGGGGGGGAIIGRAAGSKRRSRRGQDKTRAGSGKGCC